MTVKQRVTAWVAAWAMGTAIVLGTAAPVWAMAAGTYLVTMSPSYSDPESGKIDDPGNNQAIGQGMTEKLCGPKGLLEVEEGGDMYLTVRYYLSQFVTDVVFEERLGGAYESLSPVSMQTIAPVEGAVNIDEKDGYTDYRIKIRDTGSVFRGKAYIEPMGRSVVYFFTFSNPVTGSGDFITSVKEAETAEPTREAQERAEEIQETLADDLIEQEMEEDVRPKSGEEAQDADEDGDDGLNGSGSPDDPVTGIPRKPSVQASLPAETIRREQVPVGNATVTEYCLDTPYDLSQVPVSKARKLTEPLLKEAVGITGITGMTGITGITGDQDIAGGAAVKGNGNRTVMMVLLGISLVLAVWFWIVQMKQRRLRTAVYQRQAEAQQETGRRDEIDRMKGSRQ